MTKARGPCEIDQGLERTLAAYQTDQLVSYGHASTRILGREPLRPLGEIEWWWWWWIELKFTRYPDARDST